MFFIAKCPFSLLNVYFNFYLVLGWGYLVVLRVFPVKAIYLHGLK